MAPPVPRPRRVCSLCPGRRVGVRPEHPKPLPTDLPNLALVTTHPPPEIKGTSLSGGTPSGPLGRQSLAPEIPTPHLPRPQPALCVLAAEVPERFSSHTSAFSFGIGRASRKCQGPQDILPRSAGVVGVYWAGPTHIAPGRVRSCPHIAPRRAPARPLNRPPSWIALPDVGWREWI